MPGLYEVSIIILWKFRPRSHAARNTLPLHPDKILEYAALGDYEDILDLAAPLCITIPLEDIVDMIPENLFDPWVSGY